MNSDYPKISGLHYDERSGVWRRCYSSHRLHLVSHFSSSSSSQASTQNAPQTVSGQSQAIQGSKNAIGNTTTSVKNANKTSNASTVDSNNKISVANGGSVNYNTTNAGLTGADLAMFGNAITQATGSSGSGGGTAVYNTPPAGTLATVASGSNIKWIIAGAIGLVAFGLFFFLRKK